VTDTSPQSDASDERPASEDPFAEIRAAAGAVIVSLRHLLEATERVVEDPDAFDSMVSTGKSVFEAFTAGFIHDQPGSSPPDSE